MEDTQRYAAVDCDTKWLGRSGVKVFWLRGADKLFECYKRLK